jgi:hypothetical protein
LQAGNDQVAAVEGELGQFRQRLQSIYKYEAVWNTQVVVSELNFLDAHVDPETLSKHAECSVRDIVVTHVKDFKVSIFYEALLEGLNLRVG